MERAAKQVILAMRQRWQTVCARVEDAGDGEQKSVIYYLGPTATLHMSGKEKRDAKS